MRIFFFFFFFSKWRQPIEAEEDGKNLQEEKLHWTAYSTRHVAVDVSLKMQNLNKSWPHRESNTSESHYHPYHNARQKMIVFFCLTIIAWASIAYNTQIYNQ